jgi:hypothetical protein
MMRSGIGILNNGSHCGTVFKPQNDTENTAVTYTIVEGFVQLAGISEQRTGKHPIQD